MNTDRIFLVFSKTTGQHTEVVGVATLAKTIDCPVEDIPKLRLYRYYYGSFIITEVVGRS